VLIAAGVFRTAASVVAVTDITATHTVLDDTNMRPTRTWRTVGHDDCIRVRRTLLLVAAPGVADRAGANIDNNNYRIIQRDVGAIEAPHQFRRSRA
jgi:hypothetical protein